MGLPGGSKILTPSCLSLPTPHPHHRLPSISTEAARRAAGLRRDERSAVGKPGAVVGCVIDADGARRNASIDDVHLALVRRESEPLFYTLIRTVTLNGVEPEAYLRSVIARIGAHPVNRLNELLPRNIKAPAALSVAA
jgi:hypothetical protein